MSSKGGSGVEKSFAAALDAARKSPDSEEAWDHLEELADELQRPDEVAALYREVVVGSDLDGDDWDQVAQRAVQFGEEWFGDTPDEVVALLSDVLGREPTSEWAFERLTVVLTGAERWDELLDAYDRVLAATEDLDRARQLRDDAAQVAKDFAGNAMRAVGYLRKQLEVDPGSEQLASSIERLLERNQKWTDLVEHWQSRLASLSGEPARAIRLKVAQTFVEQMGDPAGALRELGELMEESPGHGGGAEQLERLLSLDGAPDDVRRGALNLLRTAYEANQNAEGLVRALEAALKFADSALATDLHRESGRRLAILGRHADAMTHYAALLKNSPSDADARKQLRDLAGKADQHEVRAEALVEAGRAGEDDQGVSLLVEAARVYRDKLEQHDPAIELFTELLERDSIEPHIAISAAHELENLLAEADRPDERLRVLERLAELEPAPRVRRSILGEAARLAEERGDADRALAQWRRRLEISGEDEDALDAVVELLGRAERWEELAVALEQRASGRSGLARRSDLVRLAGLQAAELGARDDAIATWQKVAEEFGQGSDATQALDGLLSAAERWEDLAGVLETSVEGVRSQAAELLTRLADVKREHLSDDAAALSLYARALRNEPTTEGARAGLRALLVYDSCAADAAEALAAASKAIGDWQGVADLVDLRTAATKDADQQVRLLMEAAHLRERHGQDAGAALVLVARALPLRPGDLQVERELLRLADAAGEWPTAADALAAAASASGENPARALELRLREGSLAAAGDQPERALEAFLAARALDARSAEACRHVVDVGARAGQWDAVGSAFVRHVELTGRLDEELVTRLETAAGEGESWATLGPALEGAVTSAELAPESVRALTRSVTGWLRGPAGDAAGAERVVKWGADHLADDLSMLGLLADVQREVGGEGLVDTLLRIDDLSAANLDAGVEAARSGAEERTRELWERVWGKASGMWLAGVDARGRVSVEDGALEALDALCASFDAADDEAAAIDLRLAATQLPIPPAKLVTLRDELVQRLIKRGDTTRAIAQLRERLAADPENEEALSLLGDLCRQGDRVLELIEVRNRELEMTTDTERRVQLRLEIAGLVGELEKEDGRVAALMANLDESPGHLPSIQQLVKLLELRGRHEELAEILRAQAGKLEGDPSRAVVLHMKVAGVCEERLGDAEGAIAAYEAAEALESRPATIDHLARLYWERGEAEQAASWLEKRLEGAADRDRVSVLLRLARARIKSQREDEALGHLETAFQESPRNGEVRKLLFKVYRRREAWQPLAKALNVAAEQANDEKAVLAYAREAAEIWSERLGAPEEAVPTLERALEAAPDDRALRRALAKGMRAQGRLDEAAGILRELIGSYGRRRSPERAQVHHELARVAHQNGDSAEALEQLETASKMDAGSITILKALAEMAREAGEVDRAERAYRTLLMNVKRAQGESEIGASSVLLELSRIAADRDNADKASELLESALETVGQNDDEAPQLQARLEDLGENELLERVLNARLERVKLPRRRASVFSQLADVMEKQGRDDAALDARLEALDADSSSPLLHDAAQELSSRLGKLDAYESRLDALLEGARREGDAHARCELLLRLGASKEAGGAFAEALQLYEQAEEIGVREIDVWRAMARAAGEAGDEELQRSVLEKLTQLGEAHQETRVDAAYRLAEVQLASDETLEEGIETLNRALGDEPRWERVARLCRRAVDAHEGNEDLLDVYEQAARRSDDGETLLHYLEARAGMPEATIEQIREAAEQARTLEQLPREEKMLQRAVEAAEGILDGKSQVAWAMLRLAEHRQAAEDAAGAIKWLIEASEVTPLSDVLALGKQIAAAITDAGGDLTLAAKLYEHLLDLDRTALEVWAPLADIYRELGDFDRLERLAEETLDSLDDPRARNTVRLELAHAILHTEGREDAAVEILETVLAEEPQNLRAQQLLADHLQRTGKLDELRALLQAQLEAASERGDAEASRALALRLAEQLEGDDAVDVLRGALRIAEEDADLLRAILRRLASEHDSGDRAQLLDRLSRVVDDAEAPGLALQAADAYDEAGDAAGVGRVLEGAYKRVPTDAALGERLQAVYRERGDHGGLVRLMLDTAARETDTEQQGRLLVNAARVQRDELRDPAAASATLERALENLGDDVVLGMELASTLSAAGKPGEGVERLTALLEAEGEAGDHRAELLRRRAEALRANGDAAASLEDLWAAFDLQPAVVASLLDDRLLEAQQAAASARDVEGEREVVMQRFKVLQAAEDLGAASELLTEWTERQRRDVEALRLLRDISTDAKDWEPLIKICTRLVALEEDEDQVTAALRLSFACEQAGRPEDARRGLEHARRKQPENSDLRRELRRIYEMVGAQAELGELMLEEAAAQEDPEEKANAYVAAGDMLAQGGWWQQAGDAFAEAAAIRPTDLELAAALANARIATGAVDEAQSLVDDAIASCKGRRSPQLAVLQQIQSRIAAARGDATAQLDWLAQAYACDAKNSEITMELATMAEEREEWDLAIRALRSLALLKDAAPMPLAENYARQGRISLKKGDKKLAVLWGRRAKGEDAENPFAVELLAMLGES